MITKVVYNKGAIKIARWDPFSNEKTDWFDAEWMFGVKKFDVVIGNPPYIPMESLSKKVREDYKEKYPLFKRKYETSVLFIVEGLNNLKESGVLVFIAPMTWQTGENYVSFRKCLLKEKGIQKVVNLPFDTFEAAYVDTGIYLIGNRPTKSYSLFAFDKKEKQLDLANIKYEVIETNKINEPGFKLIINSEVDSINSRFVGEGFTTLGAVTKSTQGLSGSLFAKSRRTMEADIFPFLKKGNVFNYELKIEEIYNTDLSDKPSLKQFYLGEPKILIRRIINRQDRLSVAYCEEKLVFKKDINPFVPIDDNYPAKFLLGIMASRLISKLYMGSSSIASKDDFRQTTLSELRKLPIPIVTSDDRKTIINLVNKILKSKSQEKNTEALEHELDIYVYKLYRLSYEESKRLDDSLTAEDFNKSQVLVH